MYKREGIIDEIKQVARLLGQKSITQREFAKHSKISKSVVRYHFGSWNEAIKAAGLEPIVSTERATKANIIPETDLIQDLLKLYEEHGEVTERLITLNGRYSIRPYLKRWGSLDNALGVALEAKHRDHLEPSNDQNNVSQQRIDVETFQPKSPRKRKRIYYGEPIDFRGLRFAPINEQGVVYLFGMISHELGFLVESIRTEYPDCEGKRCCDTRNNIWERIKIEFEYKSSNFSKHLHDDTECDLIVCWIHDWVECPIEVLELREAIKRLPRNLG
jgi:hypothetical protein